MSRSGLAAVLAALMLSAGTAVVAADSDSPAVDSAQDTDVLRIGAAEKWSEYAGSIVPAIAAAMQRRGVDVVVEPVLTRGSVDNVDRLLRGGLSAVLAQMDVVAYSGVAEGDGRYLVLGRIAPEALLCATHIASGIATLTDIAKPREKPWRISAGKLGSGSLATFQLMLSEVPELAGAKVELIHKSAAIELARLASGQRDLVCFVMMPNPDNGLLRAVAANQNLRFIEIVLPSVTDVSLDGHGVFTAIDVPVTPGYWGIGSDKVKTIATWVALVVDQQAMEEPLAEALALAVVDPQMLPGGSVAAEANVLYARYREESRDYAKQAEAWGKAAWERARQLGAEAAERAELLSKEAWERAGNLGTSQEGEPEAARGE